MMRIILFLATPTNAADKVVVIPLATTNQQTQILSPLSREVKAGYYNATTLDTVDRDLISDNIKEGVTIFGVTGTYISPTCFDKSPTEQPEELKHATTLYPSPPAAYTAVLGWVTAVIGQDKYGTEGSVIVKSLQLWEITSDGTYRLLTDKITCPTCWEPEDQVWGFLWPKSEWITEDGENWSKPNEGHLFNITPEGYVEAQVDQNPDMIYHFWNVEWPRPSASRAGR